MTDPEASAPGRRRARRLGAGAAALGALLLVAAAGWALAPYVAAQKQAEADAVPPLPVETVRVTPQDGYTITRRFQGRVEAARRSRVGFELAGTVEAVAVDEGEAVAAGDRLAELDTQRLKARRNEIAAALESARADLALARSTLERVRGARDQNAVSAQRLDEAQERFAAAQARVREVRARLDSVEVDLGKSQLGAPYDAIVAERHAEAGDVVQPGQPVLDLLERQGPELRIGVDAAAAETLSLGEVRRLQVRGRTLEGAVQAILPERGAATRTVAVRFVIDAELNGQLRAGDVATLTLQRRIAEPGVWLPLDALSEGTRGLWSVYLAQPVAGADHREIARRSVELLHQDGRRAYVRADLPADARVVVSGLHRLVPGQRVRLAEETPGSSGDGAALSRWQLWHPSPSVPHRPHGAGRTLASMPGSPLLYLDGEGHGEEMAAASAISADQGA
jgi:RND family efflux transporter MFP subunit